MKLTIDDGKIVHDVNALDVAIGKEFVLEIK